MLTLHALPSVSDTARPGASVQSGSVSAVAAAVDASTASRPTDVRATAAAGVVAAMPVSAWMQADPAVVPESMSALDLAEFIDTARRRHVFVADADGRLTGLVNRARLLRHLVAHRISDGLSPDVDVGDLVVRDLVTISPDTSAGEALRTMRSHRVGSLPVVDADGRLVGLVSERLLLPVADAVIAAAMHAPAPSATRPDAPGGASPTHG